MIEREGQVEVIAYFSKEQDEPIPLKVRLVENEERIVIKVEYVEDIKYITADLISYICTSIINGVEKRYELAYHQREMYWSLIMRGQFLRQRLP